MYLLDTNICVYLMKNKSPAAMQRLLQLDPTEVAVSAVTVYELEYGAAKSRWPEKNRELVKLFLAPITIVPFDSRDALAAGYVRRALEENGTPIGPYDVQIAAQGLARGWTVVTHNAGEFSRVPRLRVVDWVTDA